MRIPKSFMLGAHKITVRKRKRAIKIGKDSQLLGLSTYHRNNIMISDNDCNGDKIVKSRQCDTFCHELLHFLFNMCNRYDLQRDEKLVSDMASYLNQFFNTATY